MASTSTTRHLFPLPRIRLRGTSWLSSTCRRHFASDPPADPEFQKLRDEMLNRTLPALPDILTRQHARKLTATVSPFLPQFTHDHRSLGEHLTYFNATEPTNELLPDGLDSIHSPGPPWMRRMWAGGSMRLDVPRHYSQGHEGWKIKPQLWGVERIKDVQMRGREGHDAKLFVTIERRFARDNALRYSMNDEGSSSEGVDDVVSGPKLLRRQMKEGQQWGDATVMEERNLVFMKERSAEEMEAIRAGQMAVDRYLSRPGEPQFSHTLTPTPALLFRYSALTFNAHAIHFDPEYCRNVEGYRERLVHGPLLLTLMLKLVESHLQSLSGPLHIMQSIEYRNFAPLYCGEELRLCGREKTNLSTADSKIFDVWIEGPTACMAVKGTVRTAPMPIEPMPIEPKPSKNQETPISLKKIVQDYTDLVRWPVGPRVLHFAGRQPGDTPISSRKAKRRRRAEIRGIYDGPGFESSDKAREHILRTTTDTSVFKPLRKVMAPPSPMEPSASALTQNLAKRVGLREETDNAKALDKIKLLPLVRTYHAQDIEEDRPTPESKFERRGKVAKVIPNTPYFPRVAARKGE